MAEKTQDDPRAAAVATAEVAREWKARESAAGAVPPVPEVVAARLAGVWAEDGAGRPRRARAGCRGMARSGRAG